MKVLLLNSMDTRGGAARACQRLGEALRQEGVDAQMLCSEGTSADVHISHLNDNKIQHFIHTRFDKYFLKLKGFTPKETFSTGFTGHDISKHPLIKEADIIHLHWINRGFLSSTNIKQLLSLEKPLVWTMHDMWPFTGGCHYSMGCIKFSRSCGECPVLASDVENDLSVQVWQKKKQAFDMKHLSFITPSNWLMQEALKSSILNDARIECIPNPLNTDLFKPQKKSSAKEKLGISPDKKLILFGADNPNDERKGLTYLIDSLKILADKYPALASTVELIIFGSSVHTKIHELPFRVHLTGPINNDERLIEIYSAADLFAIPSLQDNLPNTIAEAMSCGTPCVAFDIGGIPDLIKHKENGYLVKSISAGKYMEGLFWLLNDVKRLELMSENSRVFTVQKLNYHTTAIQIIKNYKSSIERFTP